MRSILYFAAMITAVTAWAPQQQPNAPRPSAAAISHKAAQASVVGAAALAVTLFSSPVAAIAQTPQDITQGQELFQADCAECHAKLKSLPGDKPSLDREALAKYRDLDEGKIKDFVQNQFPHKFMPFQYSEKDYAGVTGYVLEKALNNQNP